MTGMIPINKKAFGIVGVGLVVILVLPALPSFLTLYIVGPQKTSSVIIVSVLSPSDHEIKWELYFNMSKDEIDQCAFLKSIVSHLISTGEKQYTMELTNEEYLCVMSLLNSKSKNLEKTAFYYQGIYFNLLLTSP